MVFSQIFDFVRCLQMSHTWTRYSIVWSNSYTFHVAFWTKRWFISVKEKLNKVYDAFYFTTEKNTLIIYSKRFSVFLIPHFWGLLMCNWCELIKALDGHLGFWVSLKSTCLDDEDYETPPAYEWCMFVTLGKIGINIRSLFSFLGHLDLWAWLFNSRKCSLNRFL